MMISDNLIIFVPNIVRAKNNFVRTRLSCFVKKLIEANGYKTTNDSSENYDIIHFPSYLDYIDNDYVIKEKSETKDLLSMVSPVLKNLKRLKIILLD